MARQYGTTLRNDLLQQYEDTIGTSPKVRIYTGTQPATPATAASGTQLVELTNATANWRNAASGGASAMAGSFTGSVGADGTAGYYRVLDSGASTCHEQGSITRAFPLTTATSSTSAGSNVLTFASTTGVSDGMSVTVSGVPTGTTVASHTSTTVNLSAAATATISIGTTVYFGDTSGDLLLLNTALTTGQTLTLSLWDRTAPGA